MVPEEGVEPSCPCGHGILSPARLPVPPLRRRMIQPDRGPPERPVKIFIHSGFPKSNLFFHSKHRGNRPRKPFSGWKAIPSSCRVDSMNLLDAGIIVLCGVLAIFGMLRGFVRQGVSLAGLVLGHILAVRYNAEAQKLLQFDFQ